MKSQGIEQLDPTPEPLGASTEVSATPSVPPSPPGTAPHPGALPRRAGPYRILRRLGAGGMGEVYEALQQAPVRRRVALKLVRWGLDTADVLARFEAERHALALMHHPAIAGVYDAGATETGRPYFVMELVSGEPVTRFCEAHRLDLRQRIELFVKVCEGVQHAHQKGIIHRDLKPPNVLVALRDGRPEPKIIDFGIAKAVTGRLAGGTLVTERGQLVGTPDYMSPEQAELSPLDVDTRSDVYSLGVLLYELLAGVRPFDHDQLHGLPLEEVLRRVRELEPPTPSERLRRLPVGEAGQISERRSLETQSLRRRLRGDLDWIVMKALAKDRVRRYGSPAQLAADLGRHLRRLPVEARPPSFGYRLGRFLHRHRLAVGAAVLVGVALLAGLSTATVGLLRARSEAEASRRMADLLEETFSELTPGAPRTPADSVEEVLARGAERIDAELADWPLMQARLKLALGRIYSDQSRLEPARALLDEALALREEHLGPDDPAVAQALVARGWLDRLAGVYPSAEARLRRAAAIQEKAYGAGSLTVANTVTVLSEVLLALGSSREALDQAERGLEIRSAILSPEHPAIADSLERRGVAFLRVGDLEAGRRDLERSLEIREKTFGTEHRITTWTLRHLGQAHRFAGDLEGARRFLERTLEIQRASLGAEHTAVAAVRWELGSMDYRSGDLDNARRHLEAARRIFAAAYGEEHPDVGRLDGILGRVAQAGGDLERAWRLGQGALANLEAALGPTHPAVTRALFDLGTVALAQDDPPRAVSLFERALATVEATFPRESPQQVNVLARLSLALWAAGDGEGRRHLETAVDLTRRAGAAGRHGSLWIAPLYNLAVTAALMGRAATALELLRDTVDAGYRGEEIFTDPDLDALRGRPELEILEREVRARRAVQEGRTRSPGDPFEVAREGDS